MGSLYKRQLNDFVNGLELRGNILLDWGGAQSPAKGRTKSWDIGEYKIVDLEVPHSESPKPDIVQDANKGLAGKILEYEGRVDIILALGLYDYVINPNITTESIKRLLSDSGYAWIEWPFVYCTHNPVEDEGCRYSEGCIKRLLDQGGLKIDHVIRKMAGNDHLLRFYQEDGQRMARGYAYHGVTGFITKVSKA